VRLVSRRKQDARKSRVAGHEKKETDEKQIMFSAEKMQAAFQTRTKSHGGRAGPAAPAPAPARGVAAKKKERRRGGSMRGGVMTGQERISHRLGGKGREQR
jgi:hypothetical protein